MTHSINDLKFKDGSTYGQRKEDGNAPHRHRCMRCLEDFDCANVGQCVAKRDVLPKIVDMTIDPPNIRFREHCPERPDWDWIRAYGKRQYDQALADVQKAENQIKAAQAVARMQKEQP